MTFLIEDVKEYILCHGIPPLPNKIQRNLFEIEKSLNVSEIIKELKLQQQAFIQEKQRKQASENTVGPFSLSTYSKNIILPSSSSSGTGKKNGSYGHHEMNAGVSTCGGPPDNGKWKRCGEDEKKFVATTVIDKNKNGIEKEIGDFRNVLNKTTNKNYDTQKDKIAGFFRNCHHEPDGEAATHEVTSSDSVDFDKLADFFFQMACSNICFCEIYARLLKDLSPEFSALLKGWNRFFDSCKENIFVFQYVDPNVDYDKYCLFVKDCDKKKATFHFIHLLLKTDVIDNESVFLLTSQLLEFIFTNMDVENKTNEIETVGDLLAVLLGVSSATGKKNISWTLSEKSKEDIRTICNFKTKEHKSLSSRFLFKMKDIVQNL